MQPSQHPSNNPSFQIISTLCYDPELPRIPHIPDSYPSSKNSPYYLLSYHVDRLLAAALDFQWPAAIAFLQQQQQQQEQPRETVLTQLTQKFNEHISLNPAHPWRLRVLLDVSGILTVEAVPIRRASPNSVPILVLPGEKPDFSSLLSAFSSERDEEKVAVVETWTLRVDTQPTNPSLFTRHKTTVREHYTAARMRAGIASLHEKTDVLIYNPDGEVMEGSITSVYFRRRRRGSSPSSSVSTIPVPVPDIKGAGADPDNNSYYWVTPPLASGGNAGTSRRYALAAGACVEEVVRVEELRGWEGNGKEGWVWLSNGVRGFMPAVLRFT
ncbi:hypothetical protein AJ78_08962 [Emergomyces pasteurianus Ep9510]|uniref:Aminodeoxychorismate lyase n=1 Tax=Emergomyces pasteurianus Ep9510 TaxID=1447872 RepID=A0A1J9NYN2_9EURO|nr:hypothetical protein AJ78_08962 [Emergomyces pasteurianus Ep9510]